MLKTLDDVGVRLRHGLDLGDHLGVVVIAGVLGREVRLGGGRDGRGDSAADEEQGGAGKREEAAPGQVTRRSSGPQGSVKGAEGSGRDVAGCGGGGVGRGGRGPTDGVRGGDAERDGDVRGRVGGAGSLVHARRVGVHDLPAQLTGWGHADAVRHRATWARQPAGDGAARRVSRSRNDVVAAAPSRARTSDAPDRARMRFPSGVKSRWVRGSPIRRPRSTAVSAGAVGCWAIDMGGMVCSGVRDAKPPVRRRPSGTDGPGPDGFVTGRFDIPTQGATSMRWPGCTQPGATIGPPNAVRVSTRRPGA